MLDIDNSILMEQVTGADPDTGNILLAGNLKDVAVRNDWEF
jgi:hypothetical protein